MAILAALIGGMVAVGLGYFANILRDDRLRRKEATSIKAALYWEMRQLQKSLSQLAERTAGFERIDKDDDLLFQILLSERPLPPPVLFDHMAAKMTVLPASLLWPVSEFYAAVRDTQSIYDDYRQRIVEKKGIKLSASSVLERAIKAVDDIDHVLRELEAEFGMERGNKPKAPQARTMINEERTLIAATEAREAEEAVK